MKCFVGLGSNLAERRENLEAAARLLRVDCRSLRASPIVETPALVPDGAPPDWQIPFLNAVVEFDWSGTPQELLQFLKSIESRLGRTAAPRWAPRVIDLDILTFGDHRMSSKDLEIPHPEMRNRPFVLAPLKHLSPDTDVGGGETVLRQSRRDPRRYRSGWAF